MQWETKLFLYGFERAVDRIKTFARSQQWNRGLKKFKRIWSNIYIKVNFTFIKHENEVDVN